MQDRLLDNQQPSLSSAVEIYQKHGSRYRVILFLDSVMIASFVSFYALYEQSKKKLNDESDTFKESTDNLYTPSKLTALILSGLCDTPDYLNTNCENIEDAIDSEFAYYWLKLSTLSFISFRLFYLVSNCLLDYCSSEGTHVRKYNVLLFSLFVPQLLGLFSSREEQAKSEMIRNKNASGGRRSTHYYSHVEAVTGYLFQMPVFVVAYIIAILAVLAKLFTIGEVRELVDVLCLNDQANITWSDCIDGSGAFENPANDSTLGYCASVCHDYTDDRLTNNRLNLLSAFMTTVIVASSVFGIYCLCFICVSKYDEIDSGCCAPPLEDDVVGHYSTAELIAHHSNIYCLPQAKQENSISPEHQAAVVV